MVWDDGDWWAGAQQCAASVAIAAAISLASVAQASQVCNYQQDDPAGSLAAVSAPADEVYWRNPVFPVPASHYLQLPAQLDPELVPAGNLAAVKAPPDDTSWRNPVAPAQSTMLYPEQRTFDEQFPKLFSPPDEVFWNNPVAPVPATLAYPQQSQFDEQTPALFPQPDEDFWVNPVAPVQSTLAWPQQWTFDEQFPTLFGQPEEVFWINPVSPAQAILYQKLPLGDVEEIPAGTLHGQPDEDFWQNPVAPVQSTNTWPQQWVFDTQDPAGSLYGVQDDATWQVSVPSWTTSIPIVFTADEVIPPQTIVPLDEGYWQNPVFPTQATLQSPQPWVYAEEFPSYIPPTFVPEEHYWISVLPQAQATNFLFQQWSSDSDWVASTTTSFVIWISTDLD
jgi:hypothetical protein